MSENTSSQEKFFGGKNELQMLPLDMIEENDISNENNQEYADFGFTDDIDTIDAKIDKSLAKERKRILKEKKKAQKKLTETPKFRYSKNEVNVLAVECTDTTDSKTKVILKNEPLFFEKENRVKGRNRLFSSKISLRNFWNGGFKSPEEHNCVKKLRNAFSKNSKRKSRMRISQWRQVAAML